RDRGERKQRYAGEEDPAPPELIAERSADQDQGAQKQRVCFDDPLDISDCGVQIALERWQGDVDNRRVDKRQARSKYRGDKSPATRGRSGYGFLSHEIFMTFGGIHDALITSALGQ